MVISCCAYNCKNRQSKDRDISFHRFPLNNEELLERWVIALRRKDFVPTKYSYICSEHFVPEDYEARPYGGKCALNRRAVPSVFDFPGQPKSAQKRRRVLQYRGRSPAVDHDLSSEPQPGPSYVDDHNYGATRVRETNSQLLAYKKALKKQIKTLQQKIRRKSSKIKYYKDLIRKLKEDNLIGEDSAAV